MDNGTKLVPDQGRQLYPAYRGKEPYIFVSYAHQDAERVFAEIRRFNEAGFHVWYDEGIAPGNEWSDEIAAALSGCSVFVVMLTPTSARRENVLNEIGFALDEGKPFLAISLEETSLTPGFRLRTSRKQAILKYAMSQEEYEYKFMEAFTRLGLKGSPSPEPGASSEKEAAAPGPLPAPGAEADRKKLSFFRRLALKRPPDNDGFQITAGLLTGYTGSRRDLVLPPSVVTVAPFSFKNCREFLESVDLGNVKIIQMNTFCDFPNLHSVRVSGRAARGIQGFAFKNCPNLTLYVRKSQLAPGFESSFGGRAIVYIPE